jgi:hypothetical protein
VCRNFWTGSNCSNCPEGYNASNDCVKDPCLEVNGPYKSRNITTTVTLTVSPNGKLPAKAVWGPELQKALDEFVMDKCGKTCASRKGTVYRLSSEENNAGLFIEGSFPNSLVVDRLLECYENELRNCQTVFNLTALQAHGVVGANCVANNETPCMGSNISICAAAAFLPSPPGSSGSSFPILPLILAIVGVLLLIAAAVAYATLRYKAKNGHQFWEASRYNVKFHNEKEIAMNDLEQANKEGVVEKGHENMFKRGLFKKVEAPRDEELVRSDWRFGDQADEPDSSGFGRRTESVGSASTGVPSKPNRTFSEI